MQFVTLLKKVKLGLLHQFLMIDLYLLDLLRVLALKQLDLPSDILISFEFILNLLFMILLQFSDLLFVFLLLVV